MGASVLHPYHRHRCWPQVGTVPAPVTVPCRMATVVAMGTPDVVDRAVGPHGVASATFDPTRAYRYHLDRTWDPVGPVVTFVMLNPSTADADVLDPTVRRCVGFARAWGYGSLQVVNLFALRATDPGDLLRAPEPVGAANDRAVVDAATGADRVVVAWGVRGTHRDRASDVGALLVGHGVRIHALGTTKDGHPRHPLYLPRGTAPGPWTTTPPAPVA